MSYEAKIQAEEKYQEALSYLQDPQSTSEKIRKAFVLLMDASENGHIESNIYLGKMYIWYTPIVNYNPQEALKHFKMAADAGYVEGQGLYGYCMLSLEHNIDTGIEYLEKAADQGDLNATEYLCRVYYGGEFGIKPDLNKAYTYSQKLPSNNNMTDMLRRKHAIQRYLFDD